MYPKRKSWSGNKFQAQVTFCGTSSTPVGHIFAPKKAVAMGSVTGISVLLAYAVYPFVLEGWNKLKNFKYGSFQDFTESIRNLQQSPFQKQQAAQWRERFEKYILQTYIKSPNSRINWYQFADIVDLVAHNTQTDGDFRKDLWALFGWRAPGVRSSLADYLDPLNQGLPFSLHNTNYQSEQMHHYLGGATGNTDFIPSHLKNNRIYAYGYELQELPVRGQYNWGYVKLFNVAERHRNDFLKRGRMTVAPNIRSILGTSQNTF
jgi:hypothetical protein